MRQKIIISLIIFVVVIITALFFCCQKPLDNKDKINSAGSQWDVVVLGLIDASWVSQHDSSPHVSYTQVLASKIPIGQPAGQLAVMEVTEHLLPEGGAPIYKSRQEEIIFLKKVVVPGYEDIDVYRVVDVMEATPQNLAAFLGQ